jgi:class 3 adenylate cyclase
MLACSRRANPQVAYGRGVRGGGSAPVTTESVAILFTDIVGSTELSQSLSPEVADDVRRDHFSILRQALAETGGTEVKNLGDGLMVVFGSASAALTCGVVMQQGVELDNRRREGSVGLRVGLSGGEVSREDDDYFGDPVVEAARLCTTCEGGQVLASDVVRLMAGRRSPHQYRALGEVTLKGLPDPVEIIEIVWEPLGGADSGIAVPLPGRLAVRPGVGVVGRQTELATLTEVTKRVARHEGREVLLISGEAGLGKTTLMAEAARAAFDAGACVLFGHCEEDLATPYQLFAEALRHLVIHAREDQLLDHVDQYGSELSRLVPALASRIPNLPPSRATDSDSERYLLFASVVGLLTTTSDQQPVILALDDLQWADEGSLLLLRHVTSADETMGVVVLGTYRDSELSLSHPLLETLAALRRQRGVSRIELTGLDGDGVVSFMEAIAGHLLDDAGVRLAHAVYSETDGNPFFVSEVLRHLSETGVIYQDTSGRWVTEGTLEELALPDSVREVIGARVGRLGPEAGKVLSLAAVIGRDFDLDVLVRATKTSEEALLDVLDAATTVALVRELGGAPGRYNFAHALIQHTLYANLGATRRARAHRVVAEALEDLCGDDPGPRVGELARHWIAATPPVDLAKAIMYSRRAADAALIALAPADALRYYVQALDLHAQADDPDPILGLDLAIGLGTAQRLTGDPAFRGTLLDAAHRSAEIGNTARLVAAALANDRGWYSAVGTIDAEKVEVLEMALDRLSTDSADRALVLATLCSELIWASPLERREALAAEALTIAEASRDEATIVRVLNTVSFPLLVPSRLEQSLARTAEALARAERLGDPLLLFWATWWRGQAVQLAGDIDEVDRCIAIAGTLAEQVDQPMLNWTHTLYLGIRALISGDTDRAEQLAEEAHHLGTDSGQADATLYFGMQLTSVSIQRGTMGELVPFIEQMIAEAPYLAGAATAVLAFAHVEGDRLKDAAGLLEEFASAGFDLPLNSSWLTAMVCYAEAAIAVRVPEHATAIFDRLAPWSDQWCSVGASAEGPVSRSLGGLACVLGRYDEADTYFRKSAAMSDRMGSKFFAAWTDLMWGKLLAERRGPGDFEKAKGLLTRAHSAASTQRYGNLERRATKALQLLDD